MNREGAKFSAENARHGRAEAKRCGFVRPPSFRCISTFSPWAIEPVGEQVAMSPNLTSTRTVAWALGARIERKDGL